MGTIIRYRSNRGNVKFILGFGVYAGGSFTNRADKVDYVSETTSYKSSYNLSQGRQNLGSTSTSMFGLYCGGIISNWTYVTRADRANYVSETTAYRSSYNLTRTKGRLVGVGTKNFGLFFGGWRDTGTSQGPISANVTDRANYTTETTSTATNYNMASARHSMASAGNLDFGLIIGGGFGNNDVMTTCERANYSAGTISTVSSYNLSIARTRLAGAGNLTMAIFMGGMTSSGLAPPNHPIIYYRESDKTDYIAETTSAASSFNSTTRRRYLCGAGNNNFGIFSGGHEHPNTYSRSDKADYIAGITSYVSSYNLSEGSSGLAGASNSNPGSL